MANTQGHRAQEIAKAELARRGTTTPDIEISGHAIDRASEHCLDIWQETRSPGEGLHAWMCRMALTARRLRSPSPEEVEHVGIRWCFAEGELYPALKTVIRVRRDDPRASGIDGATFEGRPGAL